MASDSPDFTEIIRSGKTNFFALLKRYTRDPLFLSKVESILDESDLKERGLADRDYEILEKMKDGLNISKVGKTVDGEFLDRFNEETTTDGRELVLTEKGEKLLEGERETEEVKVHIANPKCLVCGEEVPVIKTGEGKLQEFFSKIGVELNFTTGKGRLEDIDAFAIIDSRDDEGEKLFEFERDYNGYGFVGSQECFKELVDKLKGREEQEEGEEGEVGFESFG